MAKTALPMQGVWIQSLVREIDTPPSTTPQIKILKIPHATAKTQCSQVINKTKQKYQALGFVGEWTYVYVCVYEWIHVYV